ncbi:extracellular solute-binding protein [Paenibacillus senegalensis]|uniref:extracellular solute-binding protein n=1 Tax=Paenibacillus senegalensis TaxID=1465766 RepID=UPI00028904B9|nr:extracellular solute-binding protein [Paenibacillus senegalensis]
MRRENEFLYSKLAQILREQIMSGYIKPGQFLLSENELCKFYGMSRTSVRKALEQLAYEGLIVKKVGQGTIVSPDLTIPAAQEKTTLRILATAPSHFVDSGMPYLIEQFQQTHPDVEIKVLGFPAFDFSESILFSGEQGIYPDLILGTDRQFAEMTEKHMFLDLLPYFSDSFAGLYPRLLEAFQTDKKLVAAPATFSTVYLAYNSSLFEKHGVTLPDGEWSTEDFIAASKRLTADTDGDGITDQFGFSLATSFGRWPVLALQNGVRFDASTQREDVLRTLQFLHEILYKHRCASLYPFTRLLNSEAFVLGKAAMILTTAIELAGLRRLNLSFEPKVAPLPFGHKKATQLVANLFLIPETAPHKQLAVEFLQTMYDPQIQKRIGQEARFISVFPEINEQLWSQPYLESLNITKKKMEEAYFSFELFDNYALIEELEAEMEMFWCGMESAASFTDKLMSIIRRK